MSDPDDRPQQFKTREAELHEVRERMHDENQDWVPIVTRDNRDMRDPQLLGESLLAGRRRLALTSPNGESVRMRRSGRLSLRHDKLEAARAIG